MKTKFKIFKAAAVLSILLAATSCVDETEIKPNNYVISDSDVKKMGDYHNESLEKAFSNFNWEAEDYKEEILLQFKENDIVLEHEHVPNLITTDVESLEVSLEDYLHSKMSAKGYYYVGKMVTLSEKINHCTEFSEDLKHLKNQVMEIYDNEEITNTDLNALLVMIGIFDSSAYFWAPVNKGGSGKGYKILLKANGQNQNQRKEFNWRGALASDGFAAGCGMYGVAIAGMFGPVGWLSLAIVAGESAASSAFGGVL